MYLLYIRINLTRDASNQTPHTYRIFLMQDTYSMIRF